MIRFLYNNEIVTLDESRSDVTVLEWLRLRAAKTGTKEGCGTGDCGACTVVVAQVPADGSSQLQYLSVNSCIAFVGSLHAKQLISVEQLSQNQRLHIVQQSMVDLHGSQCGFCTPGFVMSLFALVHNKEALALANNSDLKNLNDVPEALVHLIDRYLGGNLCRCTGYAPIRRAAVQALALYEPDAFEQSEAQTIERLKSIAHKPAMDPRFFVPETLSELASLKINYPNAKLLAGGTDLGLEVTQYAQQLDTVMYIKHVPELLSIEKNDQTLSIGAAVSLNRCMQALETIAPNSKSMMLRFGSEQVRNQGTIGGNIANASPIGDLPPLLLALNASVCLQCGDQTRMVKLSDFYKAYKQVDMNNEEFVRSIQIPLPNSLSNTYVYKLSKRLDDDISAVCAVFTLQLVGEVIEHACVAFGGMAAVPKRALHTESVLIGAPLNDDTLAKAQQALLQDFQPISDVRASAHYRQRVAANMLQRCWYNVSEPTIHTQVNEYVSG